MPSKPCNYECYKCEYVPICVTNSTVEKKKESKIKYYLFCIRWLWKNREWENTRQKFKAMERAYKKYR